MGHMAVHQAEVAAANVALEIEGLDPVSLYNHDMMMVVDEGGGDTIYLHKGLWDNEPAIVRQGRFWSWANVFTINIGWPRTHDAAGRRCAKVESFI